MKLATLEIGSTVETLGYYTPNDGGGAQYLIVASGTGTDDGGSYHDLVGVQAELIAPEESNLLQWGGVADWDGATGTDNSTAIAAMATALNKVIIPSGRFKTILNLATSATGFIYKGEGSKNTEIAVDAAVDAITVNGQNGLFEGFLLTKVGAKSNTALALGVNSYFCDFVDVETNNFTDGCNGEKLLYLTFKVCRFEDGDYGWRFFGDTGSWNVAWFNNAVTFDRCRANNNAVAGYDILGMGMVFDACDASACPVGFHLYGQASNQRAQSMVLNAPYVEQTALPYHFEFADVTINGGFAQGGSGGSPNDTSIRAEHYTDITVHDFNTIDFSTNSYELTDNTHMIVAHPWSNGTNFNGTVDSTSVYNVLDYDASADTLTMTGATTSPTSAFAYTVKDGIVEIALTAVSATSNTTAMELRFLPSNIRPAAVRSAAVIVTDNATDKQGIAVINTAGDIDFFVGDSGPFTNTGTKGAPSQVIRYEL